MLELIFHKILVMSAAGSIVGLLLFVISLFTKKIFSSKWHYYIYLIPLLIMVLPISFSSKTANPIPTIQTTSPVPQQAQTEQDAPKTQQV